MAGASRINALVGHIATPAGRAPRPAGASSFDLTPATSGAELAAAIRGGAITSVDALEFYLSRVDAFGKDGALGQCIVVLDKERARAHARAADELLGRVGSAGVGALHGVPMTIKEHWDVPGWPSTKGNLLTKDHVPTEACWLVERLEAAGAVIYGKTNVPEDLASFICFNPVYGTCHNPWDANRSPGGSSGGCAAAISAGLTPWSVGSDFGGSVRGPANWSGTYGHRPTYGTCLATKDRMIGGEGLSTMGPLCRTAADLSLLLLVLQTPHGDRFEQSGWRLELPPAPDKPLSEWKVALWSDLTAEQIETSGGKLPQLDDAVSAAIGTLGDALRGLGVALDTESRPAFEPLAAIECYEEVREMTRWNGLPAEELARRIANGLKVLSEPEKVPVRRRWNDFRQVWEEFFDATGCDVCIMPVMPIAAAVTPDNVELGSKAAPGAGGDVTMNKQMSWPATVDGQPAAIDGKSSESSKEFRQSSSSPSLPSPALRRTDTACSTQLTVLS